MMSSAKHLERVFAKLLCLSCGKMLTMRNWKDGEVKTNRKEQWSKVGGLASKVVLGRRLMRSCISGFVSCWKRVTQLLPFPIHRNMHMYSTMSRSEHHLPSNHLPSTSRT